MYDNIDPSLLNDICIDYENIVEYVPLENETTGKIVYFPTDQRCQCRSDGGCGLTVGDLLEEERIWIDDDAWIRIPETDAQVQSEPNRGDLVVKTLAWLLAEKEFQVRELVSFLDNQATASDTLVFSLRV